MKRTGLSAKEELRQELAADMAVVRQGEPGWEAGIDIDTKVVMTNTLNEPFLGMDYTSEMHAFSQMNGFIRELVVRDGRPHSTELLQVSFTLETPHSRPKDIFIIDPRILHEKLIVFRESGIETKTFSLTSLRGIRYGTGVYAYSAMKSFYTDEGALITAFDPVGEMGSDKYIESRLCELREGTVTGLRYDYEGDDIYSEPRELQAD